MQRNGFEFKIAYGFQRKKWLENFILGCRVIRQNPNLIFFGTPGIYQLILDFRLGQKVPDFEKGGIAPTIFLSPLPETKGIKRPNTFLKLNFFWDQNPRPSLKFSQTGV